MAASASPEPGFRRRILIEPGGTSVSAELEDDWHRMSVTLHHAGGIVTAVDSEMKRRPWSVCPGAMAVLADTFVGVPLEQVPAHGGAMRTANCTHLYDLALFAAAHAGETRAIAYHVHVTDPVEGASTARLWRDGELLLWWTVAGDTLTAPAALAGTGFAQLGRWIGGLDADQREAARILRWATILAHGRRVAIPAGISGERWGTGNCFTFQPDRAPHARRNPDADRDFTRDPGPLANRADRFPPVSG